jgi:hypothetical protein
LVFLAILGYILFLYRGAIVNPALTVYLPKQNEAIASQAVTVSGKTDANSIVYILGQAVTVDVNGNFNKQISVFPGKTTLLIKAVNSFGKETVVKRDIEIKPGS